MKNLLVILLITIPQISFAAKEPLNFAFKERNFNKKPLKICVDNNFWYPYTFSHKTRPVGIHNEIVLKALKELRIKHEDKLTTLEECLNLAKSGDTDAVLSISYSDERNKYLHYPYDAKKRHVSDYRLTKVNFHPITYRRSQSGAVINYTFKGDVETLPEPIFFERAYSVGKLFDKRMKFVGDSSVANLTSLVQQRQGTLITTYEAALKFRQKKQYRDKIKLHIKPLYSKSYFLAFSASAKILVNTRNLIWKEIAHARNDRDFMAILKERYDVHNVWNL